MIVCFCVTSNDKDIASAIADGAHTVDQIGEQCGAGTGCGSCRDFIQEMIQTSGASCPGKGRCSDCVRPSSRPAEPSYGHTSLQIHAA